MSKFEKYIDEKCMGAYSSKADNKKKKKKVDENYMAGKGFKNLDKNLSGLTNVLVGWPKDIAEMIGHENWKMALQSLKNLKTKVIPDIERAIKEQMKTK